MPVEPSDIQVFDDMVDADLFSRVSRYVRDQKFKWGWHSLATDAINYWNVQYADSHEGPEVRNVVADIRDQHPVLAEYWDAARAKLDPKFYPTRVYTNLMTYGQDGGIHTDSRDPTDYTLLCYMNPEWRPQWAGETCFFDNGDTIGAVLPKPNRAVVFRANIPHVARGIYPYTPVPRVMLVFKMSSSGANNAS